MKMTLHSLSRARAQRSYCVRNLVLAPTFVLFVWLALSFVGSVASAQTFTWNGGGGSNDWNDAGNWTSFFAPPTSPPFFGDDLDFFFTGTKATSEIDVDWTVTRIDFVSGVSPISFTGQSLTVLEHGIFNNDNSTQTFNNIDISFEALGVAGGSDISVAATSGNLDFNSKILVEDGLTLNVGGANDVFFDGGITKSTLSASVMTVNKSGTGELRLRDNSTGIEQLNISGGLVLLSQTNNPTISSSLDIDVAGVATFDLNGNNANIDRLVGSGTVDLGSGTLTLGDTSDFDFFGTIIGTGGIIHNQSGTMTLEGSNTYSGATSITSGTIQLNGSGRLSNSTDVGVSSGATFDLNGVSDTVDSIAGAGTILLGGGTLTVDESSGTRTFSGDILETGEMQKNGGGTLVLSGNNSFTLLDINTGTLRASSEANLGMGTIELSAGTLNTTSTFTNTLAITANSSLGTINVNSGTTLTQSGAISGSGTIIKQGNGTLVLGTGNSYTGDTTINDGVVRLGGSNRISNSSDVEMVAGATLEMQSFTDTVRSLSGTGGSVTTTSSGARLTVDATAGTFTWGGVMSGSGGLTKAGNHTMIISSAQSYTGATNINDGLLRFSGNGDFSGASDISVASGATWDLNGLSDLVDSINGAGSILLGGATLEADEGGSLTRTFSGVISEAGNLVKDGTHTLVLTGNNTYTGTTTMDGGVLRVANSSNLGSGSLIFDNGTLNTTGSFTNSRAVSINFSDSATLDVNSGTTLTQTGIISGGSNTTLIKTGGGKLWLQGNNAFTGNMTVSNGNLEFRPGNLLGDTTTTLTVNSPGNILVNFPETIGGLAGSGNVNVNIGILDVGGNNLSTSYSGIISGGDGFRKSGTGTFTTSGIHTNSSPTTINGGIWRLSGGGLSDTSDVAVNATWDLNDISDTIDALTGNGSVTLGAGSTNTLTVGANNGSGTFSGVISENGNFAKAGSGTQTLTGNNTYSGQTQILGGTLSVGADANLGGGSIRMNSTTLNITGTFPNSRDILFDPSSTNMIDVNAAQTLTHTGTITGTNADLVKEGSGTLIIAESTTYGGGTEINGGTLQMSGDGILPVTTGVSIGGGALWDLNDLDAQVASISGGGSIFVTGGGELSVQRDGGSTTYSGVISGDGSLDKTGTHTLTLSGTNTYSGPTSLKEGTIRFSNNANLGDANGDLIFDGGTLYLLPQVPTVDLGTGRSVTLNAGGGTFFVEAGSDLVIPGVISGPGTLNLVSDNEESITLSGVNTYLGGTYVEEVELRISQNENLGDNGGDVTLKNAFFRTDTTLTNQHAVVIDGGGGFQVDAGTFTQAAGISGTGILGKSGPGTLLLTAPATHAGNTSISGGTLMFGSGELPDQFDVTVGGSATWDLNGVSDTIDGLFGTGTVLLGGGTLTVGANDEDADFGGSIQEAGSFIKIGPGTQILSGVNSYLGATEINEGVLEITNDASLGDVASTLSISDGVLRTNTTFTTGRTTTVASGAFETAGGTTLTFTSPIGGAGPMFKQGTGTLELTQSNTYAGRTEVRAGTLRLTGSGQLADTSDVDVDAGATFDITDITDTIDALTGDGDVLLGLGTLTIGANDGGGTFGGVISGIGGAIVKEGSGTEVFSDLNTYTGGTFINGGVLQISQSENLGALGTLLSFDGGALHSTASFGMIRGISLEAGGGTFDVDTATTLGASGNITGTGGLTKIGGGTLALSGFSTYLGGTTVSAGTVEISSSVNLGSTLGTLTLDGGALHTTNNITTSRETVLGASSGTIQTDGSTTYTLTGEVSGPGSLTKSGDGTLVLSAANTYLGVTSISAGIVRVDASSQLGDAGNSVLLTAGTLNTVASFTNPRPVRLAPGTGTFDVAGGTTLTQSGVLSNLVPFLTGAFTKSGTGTLLLTAANAYTGPTTINSGTVQLAGAGQLPDVTDVSIAGGAFLDLNNVDDTIDALDGSGDVSLGTGTLTIGFDDGGGTYSGTISGSGGGLVKIGTGTQLLRTKIIGEDMFPNTYTDGTAINGGVLDVEENESLGDPAGPLSFDGGTLQVQGSFGVSTTRAVTLNAGGGTVNVIGEDTSITFGGVLTGPGSLTKNGIGPLRLGADNTYTGSTIINQGLLQLQGDGRLPDASSVRVDAATGVSPQQGLDLNDIDDAIDALSGTGDIDLGSGTLTIGSANGGDEFEGSIEGTGGIVKVGTGGAIFSGVSTYTGGTALDGGRVEIDADNNLGDPSGSLSFDGGRLSTDDSFSMARATTMNAGGGTFDVTGASTLTHTGVISGSGGLGKDFTGTLVLSGINTYTGPTDVIGGTLQLGGIERLANATDVSVSAGAVFDLDSFNESIDALSGAGSVDLGAAQLVLGLNDGSGAFSGVISGTGDLLKEGTGTQTLTGANTYAGATFVDRGELILSGGGSISQATLVTGFNIGSDGTTTVDGASTTWDLSGNMFVGFDGTGQMNIEGGATVTVDGNVTVGGSGIAGTLSLDGGTLDNSAGNGITVTTGSLQGDGTVIGNVFNQDTVAPGGSAGILDLTGNYSQDTTGLFSVEVGGTDNSDPQNPQFDLLDITGTAALAGQLELALLDGFTPAPTDTFTVLTSSTLSGVFSNVANGARLDLSSGGTGSFQVDYTATSLLLSDFQGTGTSFPGDGNGDGMVDGLDYLLWAGNFGDDPADDPPGSPENGDFNDDGVVDGIDYLVWASNFGAGTATSVPEPGSLALIVIGLAACGVARRRR